MKASRANEAWGWRRAAGWTAALLVGGILGVSALRGAQRDYRLSNRSAMRMKLAWSDGILEGLTLEKYEQISRDALRLRDLTQSNLWYTTRQPEYMRLTTNFQRSAQAVYRAAADQDLAGATEAYTRLIGGCVDCHRLVRIEQRGRGRAPSVETVPPRRFAREGPR